LKQIEEEDERMTFSKLEYLQSSIQIDGECKLTLNFNDPDAAMSGQIPGLSQELSSSRVEPKNFQFDKVFGPDQQQVDIFEDVKDVVRSVIDG
jgi:hypothetical protein